MNKPHKGGMPSGRHKRGSIGTEKKRIYLQANVSAEEKRLVEEAAAYEHITISQYVARAAVIAAKADLSRKLRQ